MSMPVPVNQVLSTVLSIKSVPGDEQREETENKCNLQVQEENEGRPSSLISKVITVKEEDIPKKKKKSRKSIKTMMRYK